MNSAILVPAETWKLKKYHDMSVDARCLYHDICCSVDHDGICEVFPIIKAEDFDRTALSILKVFTNWIKSIELININQANTGICCFLKDLISKNCSLKTRQKVFQDEEKNYLFHLNRLF